MTSKEINKIWGKKMIDTLDAREAAIMFAFGMDKKRRVTVWATQDLPLPELKKELQKIIDSLGG